MQKNFFSISLRQKLNVLTGKCPAFMDELEQVLDCPAMREYSRLHKGTFDAVQNHTGLEKISMKNIGQVYDTLLIQVTKYRSDQTFTFHTSNYKTFQLLCPLPTQSLYGLQLPEWANDYFPEPMKTLEEFGFQVLSANRKMIRLNGGPLLTEVMGNMKAAKQRAMPICPSEKRV